MNDKWHEPQIVANTKNAIGYFIVFGLVSCGILFIFGGMFCPFVWIAISPQRWNAFALMWQETEKEHGKTVSLEQAKKTVRKVMGWLFVLWFIVGWGLFIIAHMTYMNG